MLKNITWEVNDNYNTPKNGWEDILQFVPKETKLWLPFYNDGECETILKELGYNELDHRCEDFFAYDIPNTVVIDNPPYSCKKEVINKLKKRGVPFALLLPIGTLERQYIYGTENLQIVIPRSRYKFKEGLYTPPFKACWFCWDFQSFLKTDKKIIWI